MALRLLSILLFFLSDAGYSTCTYELFDWDTHSRKAINHRVVSKNIPSPEANEIDSQSGCSVCKEDQTQLLIPGMPTVQVCKTLAQKIYDAIVRIRQSGFIVRELSGYRVGKTRGPATASGLRTEFSNHSYGAAIDFNASWNGLYSDCFQFNPGCRLIRGGPWQPEAPEGINTRKAIVQILEAAGFKWGGAIAGRQKDFMHFSLSGY